MAYSVLTEEPRLSVELVGERGFKPRPPGPEPGSKRLQPQQRIIESDVRAQVWTTPKWIASCRHLQSGLRAGAGGGEDCVGILFCDGNECLHNFKIKLRS